MKLRDLKIGTQLRVGMGTILVFVALLGATAWFEADSLWQDTKRLYEHPLTVGRALDQLTVDIRSVLQGMRDLVLTENEQKRQSIIQRIDTREADAARRFDILYDRYLGPRSDIDDARNAFVQWKSIREETIRLLRTGKTDEAANRTKSSGVDGGHVEILRSHMQKISDFANNRADQFYRDAQQNKDDLMRQLGMVFGAILLLTMGVGYLLLRGIRKPLKELTSVADRFRRGELDTRSRYISANEFGTLSAAFNALAETVRTEWRSKESAARIAAAMLQEEELRAFCRALIKELLTETGSQIGAVYLLNEPKTAFDHFESIGLAPAGRASFSAAGLEGEFGSALATRKIQRLTDIPAESRFTFATVGGDFQPCEIITIPIPGDGGIAAVISLAGVRGYPEAAVRLVNDSWSVMTARLNGVLASGKIRAFAEQLEQQNQELQAQQEELEAQAEELRKQSEELQGQNVELEQQRLMVEEASRLKSQFLSNMSHELRTPLNSVMALSRVLMMQAKAKLSAEEINYLEIIERNGKNLLTLINDILDLSKIEAGRMDVNPKPFSLRLTLENILESIAPLAGEKEIELRQKIPEDLPPLESDEIRVSQILQNLIGNAVKFTVAGCVTVSVLSDQEKVSVRIADTGIGIAEIDLPYIFDEFRQVDGSAARRHEGSGLGLAIARKAAQMLGGDIAVTSAPEKGSTFTLTLPIAWQGTAPVCEPIVLRQPSAVKSKRKTILAVDDEPETAAMISNCPPRILLVEDNEAAIIQVKAVLESAGYFADVARGGQEAMDYVSHTIPEGIVLDLMMPEIDGFAVLEKIRGTQATVKIPVLILTAKDLTPEDLLRLSANHIQQLVQKGDVDRESLLSKVKSMLGTDSGPQARVYNGKCSITELSHNFMRRRADVAPGSFDRRKASGVSPDLISAGAPQTTAKAAAILIIEDNPDNMTTIKAVLQNRCRILEATDGEEGLRMAAETGPDLILLDMALPKMDGLTVIRHLRDNAKLRPIPVIAMTAQVMKGDRERILEAGCDDYIAKPIDPEDFLKKIGEWLKGDFHAENTGD
jgi:signal transduction histidine kinase/CheY-like chemotaxis protein/HAMP domain-containing protein